MDDTIDIGLLLAAQTTGTELLDHLGGQLGMLAGAALALVGAFAGVTTFAIQAGEQVLSQAQSVQKLSTDYGVSTDAIQQWHGMMQLAGDSTGSVDSAFQRLSLRIGMIHNAFLATGKVAPALLEPFKQLKLSAADLEHAAPDVILQKILAGLEQVPNATDRAFLGVRTLGGGWKDLYDMYVKTGGMSDAMMQKVKDSGTILGVDTVANAQAASMSMNLLGLDFQGVKDIVGVAMIPVFEKLDIFLQDMMPTFKNMADFLANKIIPAFLAWAEKVIPLLISNGKKLSDWFVDIAIPAFKNMWTAIQPLIDDGKKLIDAFFSQFSTTGIAGSAGILNGITAALKEIVKVVQPFMDYLIAHPKMMDLLLGALVAKAVLPSIVGGAPVAGAVGGAVLGGKLGGTGGAIAGGLIGAGLVSAAPGIASGFEQALGMAIARGMGGVATRTVTALGTALLPKIGLAGLTMAEIWSAAFVAGMVALAVAGGIAVGGIVAYWIDMVLPNDIDAVHALFTGLAAWFGRWADSLATAWQKAGSDLRTWLVDKAKADIEMMKQNFLDFVNFGRTIGMNFAGALMAGIGTLKGDIMNWAKSTLPSWIKGPLGISSPSSVMMNEVGLPMMQGIVAGITGNAGLVSRAITGAIGLPGFSGGGGTATSSSGDNSLVTLMQELLAELQTHRLILNAIAGKDLGPAVNKVITSRLAVRV